MKISKFLFALFLFISFISTASRGQSLDDYLKQGLQNYNTSDFRGALEVWDKGLAIAKGMDNKLAIVAFLANIGVVCKDLGNYTRALSFYEQALKIQKEIGDRNGEGRTLGNIGSLYCALHDYSRALSYYEQALKIRREIEDRRGEGTDLSGIGIVYSDLGDYPKALSYHEQALKIERDIENKKGEGETLSNIGTVYSRLGDYPKALSFYERAIKIQKEIGDKTGEAGNLARIGVVYSDLGDYPKALSFYEQALKIQKEIGDKTGEGITLGGIGVVYKDLGDYARALSHFEKSLKIKKEIGDKAGEGITLGGIGVVYKDLGDYPKALSYHEQALKIEREMGNKKAEGETLSSIGTVYYHSGDYPKALSYYEQSLKISREIGNRNGEGGTLMGIGTVHQSLGNYPKALSYYEQSLKISRETGDRNGEWKTFNNIGSVYQSLGDHSKALSYCEQSLKISREIGDRNGEGITLGGIGVVYWNLGNYAKALSCFEQSLKISREIGDRDGEGITLGGIGVVYRGVGDYARALFHFEESLKINKERGDKKGEGITIGRIGVVYRDLGDYPKALSYYEQSLKISREIRNKNGEGITLNNIGDLYSHLGNYAKALSYFEQSLKINRELGRPTSLQETNIGDAYLEQGKFKECYEIFNRLNVSSGLGKYYLKIGDYKKAEEEFSKSLKRTEAKEMPDAEFLLADYIGLGLSYEGLKEYGRAKEYFQKGIGLIEKQRVGLIRLEWEHFIEGRVFGGFSRLEPYEGMVRVLMKEQGKDYQRNALFYAERGKSRTFLEMLSARGVRGRAKEDEALLAKEKGLQQELLVLRKRMEVLDRLGDKAPKGDLAKLKGELNRKEEEYERFIKEVKLRNSELASLISVSPVPIEKIQTFLDKETTLLEYFSTKNTLYTWLLTRDDIKVYVIALKEKDLKEKVHNFLLPNISNRSRKAEPVITLSVDDEHKKETPEREREENRKKFHQVASEFYNLIMVPIEKDIKTEKLIIVPHGVLHKVPFSTLTDGQRYLVDKYAISVLPSASVIEFIVNKRKVEKDKLIALANPQTDYVPLGFAEIEGKALSNLFPGSEVYYRERATETLAKKRSSDFNIIHFASHGEFNDRQPLQSGLLLAKDSENDGYLQVHEIFGMDLRNANLVTLSACETALSKVTGGDDLVGLSRGFIYAGTPSLLATLWKVDDRSTSILMEHFYKNWQKGMSKPEALRQAQIALKAMPQYKHPYYWAPFVMIGDWK